MSKPTDKLTDHNYDGIQEYDNDLPKWWVWLFYITIIWGLGYAAWMHLGPSEWPQAKLERELKELEDLKVAAQATSSTEDTEDSGGEQTKALSGKAIFEMRCAACHMADGGGSVGPNLTDKHWIHGYSRADIRKTISEGVPAKGMISWKTIMPPREIDAVTDYVISLKGTKPAKPKAPQGDIVEK